MNNRKLKIATSVILLILVFSSLGVVPVILPSYISNVSITNVNFDFSDCALSFNTSFDYYHLITSYGLSVQIFGDGMWIGAVNITVPESGSGSVSLPFNDSGSPGPYTECSAIVQYKANGGVSVTQTLAATSAGEATPWFYTPGSVGDLVTSNHQTVLYDGAEACGVFYAGWYGRKYITPENFPGCADYLPDGVEVACMNEEAVWTADNITGSGVSEGVFYAIVEQHGTCGIFPAG